MKKYLVFAVISVFCVFASACSVQNNDSKSPASTTALQTTEQKNETTSPTEKPTEVTSEKPTEESTEKPTEPPTIIDTEQTIRTIADGDTIELTGTVTVEEDNSAANYSTSHAILNLDNPFSCYLIGMNYDGSTVYEIDSVQIDSEYMDKVGEHVTVSGTVMTAHTGHHLRDIVII